VTGAQCDTCRTFSAEAQGWLFLVRNQPASSLSMLFPGAAGPEVVGTFCSPRCAAEYAYVLAAAESAS
jgi:hypothetical protein